MSSPSFLMVVTPLVSIEDLDAKQMLCKVTWEPRISNSGEQDCERKEFQDVLLGKAEERGRGGREALGRGNT